MKRSTLRSILIKQINEIGAELREQTVPTRDHGYCVDPKLPMLSTQHAFHRLLLSLFNSVYFDSRQSMWAKDFNAFASFFSLPKLAPTAKWVSNPDAYTLQIATLSADDAEVVVGVVQSIHSEIPGTEEQVMEWVTVDADTKVRRPATDGATGKPLMKKTKPKEEQEKRVFEYHFPLDFFVDLFKEIGRESIYTVPDDYIPAPLGVDISRILYGMDMPPMMIMSARGGFDHPHNFPHHPMRDRFGQSGPVRIFLKPEKGTDRMEVILEPYPPEQVKAHRELIRRREAWAQFRLNDTTTVKAFLKLIPKAPKEEPKAKVAVAG